jgi:hypothetical protein
MIRVFYILDKVLEIIPYDLGSIWILDSQVVQITLISGDGDAGVDDDDECCTIEINC